MFSLLLLLSFDALLFLKFRLSLHLALQLKFLLFLLFNFLFRCLFVCSWFSAFLDALDHIERLSLCILGLKSFKLSALQLVFGTIYLALIFVRLFFFLTHLAPFCLNHLHYLLWVKAWVLLLDHPSGILTVENERWKRAFRSSGLTFTFIVLCNFIFLFLNIMLVIVRDVIGNLYSIFDLIFTIYFHLWWINFIYCRFLLSLFDNSTFWGKADLILSLLHLFGGLGNLLLAFFHCNLIFRVYLLDKRFVSVVLFFLMFFLIIINTMNLF